MNWRFVDSPAKVEQPRERCEIRIRALTPGSGDGFGATIAANISRSNGLGERHSDEGSPDHGAYYATHAKHASHTRARLSGTQVLTAGALMNSVPGVKSPVTGLAADRRRLLEKEGLALTRSIAHGTSDLTGPGMVPRQSTLWHDYSLVYLNG